MKPTELSRAVAAPVTPAVEGTERDHLGRQLLAGMASEVGRLPEGEQLEITLPWLRRALARPDLLPAPGEPFAWQPKFVRRSLGLAAVSACAVGRFRTPAEAVGPVAAEALAEWARTGWKAFHWEPWYAALPPAARAAVLAEAVSWATSFWTSFDWTVFGDRLRVGGPDDHWVLPLARTVRLKGRCELRVRPEGSEPAGARSSGVSLVSLAGGTPTPAWRDELAFLAVVLLRPSSRPVPARVTGLWPDAGEARVLEIDRHALEHCIERLVAAVATLVDGRAPSLAAR